MRQCGLKEDVLIGWVSLVLFVGCAHPTVKSAKQALAEYQTALAENDAAHLYEMLDAQSRRIMTVNDVRRALAESRGELVKLVSASISDDVQIFAQLHYPEGERTTLRMADEQFEIESADALPAIATSPVQALEQLRRVLARRSYAGFLRVLSTQTRAAIDNDMNALVEGLEHPERLSVDVVGNSAEVELHNGFRIKLRRESGAWKIMDID